MMSQEFLQSKISVKQEVETVKLKEISEAKLEQASIPRPKHPSKEHLKPFPDDITDVPNRELGAYIGMFESEASWVRYCVARREIDLLHAQSLLSFVYDKLYVQSKQSKLTATDLKHIIQSDSFYKSCELEVIEIKADLKLLCATLTAYESYAKAISREITNRERDRESFPQGRVTKPFNDGEIFHDNAD